MTISDIIRRSGRSLKSAKARTILTALAIAVGTFALTLTLAASNGATAYVKKIIAENFDPAELIVTADESLFGRSDTSKPQEYDPSFGSADSNSGATTQIKRLTDDDIAKIKDVDSVESVRENIAVNLQYLTRPDQKKYIGTVQALSPAMKMEAIAGDVIRPMEAKTVLLPEGYIEPLGFKSAQDAVGQKITLVISRPFTKADIQQGAASVAAGTAPADLSAASQSNSVSEEFTIAAVLKKPTSSQPGTELYMYISQDEARRLNDISTKGTSNFRKYTYVYAKIKNGEDNAKLQVAQENIKQLGFQAQSVKDTQEFLTSIIAVLQGIVAGFGAIAVIASVFGIVNTMYISVLQRTREIGLMKALGMRKRDIGQLFRFEAAWIGFLGGVIGSVLAVGVGIILNPAITKQLKLGDGNILLIFKPAEIIMLIVILMIVSILAGWLPSRKAAKLDPIEALRTE